MTEAQINETFLIALKSDANLSERVLVYMRDAAIKHLLTNSVELDEATTQAPSTFEEIRAEFERETNTDATTLNGNYTEDFVKWLAACNTSSVYISYGCTARLLAVVSILAHIVPENVTGFTNRLKLLSRDASLLYDDIYKTIDE